MSLRKKRRMSFPEDLAMEIMLRLPSVKSAVRASCVCKAWHDIIFKDQHFMDTFSNRINKNCCTENDENENPLMLFHRLGDKSQLYQIQTHCSRTFGHVDFMSGWGLVPPRDSQEVLYNLGSCNGILFLDVLGDDQKYRLHLYNPITREYRKLPTQSIPWSSSWDCDTHGFGYDDVSNVYKAISIHAGDQVEIYNLETNSWRRLDVDLRFLRETGHFDTTFGYLNGCCYWRFHDEGGFIDILTFDFRTETFGLLMSEDLMPTKRYDYLIGLLDNSIAVCFPDKNEKKEVWGLETVNDMNWIKKFTISGLEKTPRACWLYGTNLIAQRSDSLFLVTKKDEEGENTRTFKVDSPDTCSMTFKPSLISLRSGCFMPALRNSKP